MKKIFCIFSVVLILIMATVPCFADSKPMYFNQLVPQDYIFFPAGTAQVVSPRYTITFNNTGWNQGIYFNAFNAPRYHRCMYIVLGSDFDNHSLSVDYLGGSGRGLVYFNSSTLYTFDMWGSNNRSYFCYFYANSNDFPFTIKVDSFMCVDLTAIYGDDAASVTADQFFNDFPIFLNPVPSTQSSVYTGSFFDPIIDLYSKLPESFHYFGSLFSNTGVGFSIFFWVMLMISIVVFIICLILRRCRS